MTDDLTRIESIRARLVSLNSGSVTLTGDESLTGSQLLNDDLPWLLNMIRDLHVQLRFAQIYAARALELGTEYAERANYESATRSTREMIERTEYLTHEMERGQL